MDKATPTIPIILDKERNLKFSIGAVIRFKEITGKDLRDPKVIEQIKGDMELEDLRAFLWACLRHEDKTLTLEAAGDMVDFNNLAEIAEKIGQAVSAGSPERKEEGESGDPPAIRPNG